MPPLIVLFFLIIPESFIIAYVGTRMLKIGASTKQLITIAFLNSLLIYVVRSEFIFGKVIQYGIHTFFIVATLTIIIGLVLKIPFKVGFAVAALPIMLILLGDSIIAPKVIKAVRVISIMDFPKYPWHWILYGWATDGILITAALYLRITGKPLFVAPGLSEEA